jgi:DUF4097 and DUF4098 domain-containing protein YvlB
MANTYDLIPGARLRVLTVSGNVSVIGEDRTDIEVEPANARLHEAEEGRVMEVKSKSNKVTVRVPEGLNVSIGTVSGDITITGKVGTVKISTISGRVESEANTGDADIRSISGNIILGACGGRCRANTKSGRIEIGHAGGAVKAHTMSGRIDVGTAGQEEIEIKTISGSIGVAVDPGRSPRARLKSLSGRTKCDCPPGSDFEIRASSISGSIEVTEK